MPLVCSVAAADVLELSSVLSDAPADSTIFINFVCSFCLVWGTAYQYNISNLLLQINY